jgi:uncharacterized protein YodC (DUF2158 family)
MNEPKFKIGDRVRHKSEKNSPAMVVVEIKSVLNQIGNMHCQYWHNGEFKSKFFISEELVQLADSQP